MFFQFWLVVGGKLTRYVFEVGAPRKKLVEAGTAEDVRAILTMVPGGLSN